MNNIGQFFLKLSQKMDDYRREVKQMNHNYEIEKAQTADRNDESIEKMNEEFMSLKLKLKQSLHHPRLQETIEECFTKLDEIEQEYRNFHEENQNIVKNHPQQILLYHQQFERAAAAQLELVGEDRRPQIEAAKVRLLEAEAKRMLAKEEYLKRMEEEKLIEEAKNKKGGKAPAANKKDPKKW